MLPCCEVQVLPCHQSWMLPCDESEVLPCRESDMLPCLAIGLPGAFAGKWEVAAASRAVSLLGKAPHISTFVGWHV